MQGYGKKKKKKYTGGSVVSVWKSCFLGSFRCSLYTVLWDEDHLFCVIGWQLLLLLGWRPLLQVCGNSVVSSEGTTRVQLQTGVVVTSPPAPSLLRCACVCVCVASKQKRIGRESDPWCVRAELQPLYCESLPPFLRTTSCRPRFISVRLNSGVA